MDKNMQCRSIEDLIDDILDQQVEPSVLADAELHFTQCESCRHFYRQSKRLHRSLSKLSRKSPNEHFVSKVIAEARQQANSDEPVHRQRRYQRFRRSNWFNAVSSIAAGIALWFVFSFVSIEFEQGPALPEVQISLNHTKNINMTLYAEYAMASVQFSVRLPDGVELAGMPGKRDIHWNGSLKRGKNLLSLPVIAHSDPNGALETIVTHAGKSKVYKIRLALDAVPI